MKHMRLVVISLFGLCISCGDSDSKIDIPPPKKTPYASNNPILSEVERYDKVLGALVGSAIGDAMGASTEMWHRRDIQLKYQYITGLTAAVRDQSPEGTWEHNLSPGATTDDTRWKYAMVKYFSEHGDAMTPKAFADFISSYYTDLTKDLSNSSLRSDPDLLDEQNEKIDWIKEWARVALAYQEGSEAYQRAQHRFYGGEMSCAGQLYTPMFGLIASNPEEAYSLAYEHTLFDLGYAKDISALVAAMTQMAMHTQSMDSIINTATFIDPLGYQDSRLVGRLSHATANAAVNDVLRIKNLVLIDSLVAKDTLVFKRPKGFPGNQKAWVRQEMIYQLLEKDQKAIAFHAGEIWQILITGLQFGEGDFMKTLQFMVNYGRDNDTVAAVAGMILGAKAGYSNLPQELRESVVTVSREQIGIDLEAMARELIDR